MTIHQDCRHEMSYSKIYPSGGSVCREADEWEQAFQKDQLSLDDCIKYCDFLFQFCRDYQDSQKTHLINIGGLRLVHDKFEFNHPHLKTMLQCVRLAQAWLTSLHQTQEPSDAQIKTASRIVGVMAFLVQDHMPKWRADVIQVSCTEWDPNYVRFLLAWCRLQLQMHHVHSMIRKTQDKTDLDEQDMDTVRVAIAWHVLSAAYLFQDAYEYQQRVQDKKAPFTGDAMNDMRKELRKHVRAVYGILGHSCDSKDQINDAIKLLRWAKESKDKIHRLHEFWEYTEEDQTKANSLLNQLELENDHVWHFTIEPSRVIIPIPDCVGHLTRSHLVEKKQTVTIPIARVETTKTDMQEKKSSTESHVANVSSTSTTTRRNVASTTEHKQTSKARVQEEQIVLAF